MLQKIKLPEEVKEQLEDILSYIEEGEIEDAVDIIDALAEEFPDSFDVALHRVIVYRSLGINNDLILPLIESCHAVDPNDLEVWFILIEELAELGFFGLAEKEVELLKSSTNVQFESTDSEELFKSITAAAQHERSDFFGETADAAKKYLLLNLADKALYFRDFDSAKRYTEDLKKDASDALHTWIINSRFHFLSNELKEAEVCAKTAIEKSPTHGEAYYILSFAEILQGRQASTSPLMSLELADSGISYQAYHLILTEQFDALLSLYDKNSDTISSHSDAVRFFECVAFVLYSRGEIKRANSLWQFANTLEPQGSLLAELQLGNSTADEVEKPFVFFGPSEFPYFFSSALENFSAYEESSSTISFSKNEINILPHIFETVLKYADSELVKLTSQIILDYKEELLPFFPKISASVKNFAEGKRLSSETRAFVAHLSEVFGGNVINTIYHNGQKVYIPFDKLLMEAINPCVGDSEEYFYFDIIQENMMPESLPELEEMCRSMFEKSSQNPHIGVEYVHVLQALGKHDEADFIIKDLYKKNPEELSVKLLALESQLPENISEAKNMISSLSEKKLTPIEFREFQLLKSSLALLDASIEKSLLELDVLQIALPAFKVVTARRRESIASSDKDEVIGL